jgi:hypothetical protein
MRRALLLPALLCIARLAAADPVTDPAEQVALGRALAGQLRALQPRESVTNLAVLRMRDDQGRRRELRVECRTVIGPAQWSSHYIASSTNAHAATLIIRHEEGQPNRYLLQTGADTSPLPAALAGNDTMRPFAGSDYWLADLGLEFFHWPEQRVLKKELRSGEACRVLESVNPNPAPGGYRRVVAWIDNDTLGIVHADAYDSGNKLLKAFAPKKFRKVKGQWQLEEMEIRNEQADTRTSIVFDLEPLKSVPDTAPAQPLKPR